MDFWTSDSLETLIFSNYVGAAAIFEYMDQKTELLRVNKKYLQELGMNMEEKDIIYGDVLKSMDENGHPVKAYGSATLVVDGEDAEKSPEK